jgi:molecular chaperone HscC
MREAPESSGSGNIIGIHLGMTTTQVARFTETGEPEITNNSEGSSNTPSVVQIDDDGCVIVGREAKKFVGTGTPNVFAEFKREMGSEKSWPIGSKTVTPVELSALLLKKVVADYAEQFGQPQSVVITWPANYRHAQREATMQAAALAGLRGVNYIEEPTAAALYYSSHRTLDGKYLIVDFSEGKFDATLLEIHRNSIQVLHQDGVQHLGVKDLELALLKIIEVKYFEKTGDEFDAIDCSFDKLATKGALKTLSTKFATNIRLVSSKHGPIQIYITRHEFEVGIRHLVAQAEMACENVLRCGKDDHDGHVKKSEVEAVFMTGALARIPAFRLSILRQFGKTPIVENPEHSIALGAAIYAAHRSAGGQLIAMQVRSISDLGVVVRAPHYLGTIIPEADGSGFYNEIVIAKGTPLPCASARKLRTTRPDQRSLTVEVTQSAIVEQNVDFVTKIAELSLELPPGLPAGYSLWAIFEYDANGCANVHLFSDRGPSAHASLRPAQ